jgi:hypothetical protein
MKVSIFVSDPGKSFQSPAVRFSSMRRLSSSYGKIQQYFQELYNSNENSGGIIALREFENVLQPLHNITYRLLNTEWFRRPISINVSFTLSLGIWSWLGFSLTGRLVSHKAVTTS